MIVAWDIKIFINEKLGRLLVEMSQIFAETVTNKIQITAVKSIFLYAAPRYIIEALYSVFLNTVLGPRKFSSKFAEK